MKVDGKVGRVSVAKGSENPLRLDTDGGLMYQAMAASMPKPLLPVGYFQWQIRHKWQLRQM